MGIQMSDVIFSIIAIWSLYSVPTAIFAAVAPTGYKKKIKKTKHYYWKIIAAVAFGPVLISYSLYIYDKKQKQVGRYSWSGILEIPPKIFFKEECK